MRFLSLVLLSGCALVDATKDPHGGSDAGGSGRTFVVQKIIAAGLNDNVQQIVPANLDGVDPIDLLVRSDSNLVGCFNKGTAGTMVSFLCVQIEAGYQVIGAGDLDGDGLDDPIGAAIGVLDVHERIGAEAFMRTAQLPTQTLGGKPQQIISGHFPFLGGPAPADSIVISYEAINKFRVIVDALGTAFFKEFDTDIVPFDMVAAELDSQSNGTDELLIATQTVIEFQGDNDTFLQKPRTYADASRLAVGQLVGNDGRADLVFAQKQLEVARRLVIVGTTDFGLPEDASGAPEAGDPQLNPLSLVTGEFSGDQLTDFAALNGGNRRVHVFTTTQPDGTDPSESTFDLGGLPTEMVAGDFDGDGITDLAVIPGNAGGVDLLLSR